MQLDNQMNNQDGLRHWLAALISARCKIDRQYMDADTPFDEYGVDSLMVVGLTSDIGARLGVSFEPTILFQFNTVNSLASYLCRLGAEVRSEDQSTEAMETHDQ